MKLIFNCINKTMQGGYFADNNPLGNESEIKQIFFIFFT